MVKRITITLEQDEYSALLELAIQEMRNVSDQARFIIRSELERQGQLPIPEIREINKANFHLECKKQAN